jgi:tRNA dimethylallyltransferase
MAKAKIIFIVGPTGTGKTEVGLSLSGLLPSEFISADSMQIYKGMDVVTDKLPLGIRKKYPYHLIDIIEPTQEYNVAIFCQAARKIIKIILKKKKTPVVIGGTGLYVNSLLYGIFKGKSADRNLRRALEAEADAKGTGLLYKRLEEIDPEAAHKIDPHNKRRIIRALEAYGVAQKPFSLLQKKRRGLSEDYDVFLFGLRRKRGDLYARIDRRVDFMANAGLLDEVRRLLKKKLSKTAYHCIGLREVEGFFKGLYDFGELLRLIKRNSRHFAKRQMTWFNKNKDIDWIDLKEGEDPSGVACLIYKKMEN